MSISIAPKPDRLAVLVEQMRDARAIWPDAIRAIWALASGRVAITLPAIDWRNVWNRDYVGATRTATEATTK
jgi:hypothetical protein